MNPFETSKDPIWHSVVTGIVVFAMGATAGVAFMGYLLHSKNTASYQVINQIPTINGNQTELNGSNMGSPIVIEEL